MPISIQSFRDKFNSGGPTPTNRFEVSFEGNVTRNLFFADLIKNDLKFFVDTAEIPPRSLSTVQDKVYGPIRNLPYGSTYIDTTMAFLCTSNGLKEKRFFDSWQDYINPTKTYDVKYYDDFTANIRLVLMDEQNSPVYTVTYKEAFPMIVSGIQLGQANDEFARISVTFSFHHWERDDDLTSLRSNNIT